MNQSEFKQFTVRLYASFPSILKWLTENSPSPADTEATWFKVLRNVEFEEANYVLDRWTQGEIPPPLGYKMDVLAIDLRQCVMADKAKMRKIEIEASKRQEIGKREMSAAFKSIYRPYCELSPFAEAVKRGEMTKQEFNDEFKRIEAKYFGGN